MKFKTSLTLLLAALTCGAAQAQYFPTKKGMTLHYEDKNTKENITTSTVSAVEEAATAADGTVSVRIMDKTAIPGSEFGTITSYTNCTYNPADSVSTLVLMNADDYKESVYSLMTESIAQSGQFLSQSDLDDLKKNMRTKGELAMAFGPNTPEGTKLPNKSIRLDVGPMSMSMNLWEGKVLGNETIEVPAGKFDCKKISYTLRTTTPEGTTKAYVTVWYAEGVGTVRTTHADKKGNIESEQILQSVTAPAQ